MIIRRCIRLCVLTIAALAGCTTGKYDLSFRPANGSEFRLVNSLKGEVEISMVGQALQQPVATTIASSLRFDTLPDGYTRLAFGFVDYHVQQGSGEHAFDTDSLLHKDSVALSAIDFLKKARFTAIMNAQGQLESKVSTDSVWQLIEAALAPLDTNVRRQVGVTLRPLINDDMMGGTVEQCFYILPGKRVNVGDTWTNQIRIKSIFTLLIVNEFELVSVSNGVAEIKMTATVSSADNKVDLPGLAMAGSPTKAQPSRNGDFNLMGLQLNAQLKGTQKGQFFVDMGTGLMQKGVIEQNLNGSFSINGMEIPMKVKLQNECKLIKP